MNPVAMRSVLKSALCLCLSPLLAAQQIHQDAPPPSAAPATQIVFAYPIAGAYPALPHALLGFASIPSDLPVEVTAASPSDLDTAAVGTLMRLQVARDVVLNGATVLRAGTPIEGTVTKVQEGKLPVRKGTPELRVKEIEIGKSLKLEMRSARTRQFHRRRIAKNAMLWPGRGLIFAAFLVALPIWLPFALVDCEHSC